MVRVHQKFGRHLASICGMGLRHLVLLIAATLGMAGCSDTYLTDLPRPISEYFPLTEGKQRTYLVIDTTFMLVTETTSDSSSRTYYLQETAGGTETDLLGRTLRQIDRDTSIAVAGPFAFQDRWRAYVDDAFAEEIEGNRRVIVLASPIEKGYNWNGNAYNNLGEERFTYLNTDTTVTVNGQTFMNCVFIEQRLEKGSLTQDIYTYEIYAPGIGKIVRFDRQRIYDLPPGGGVVLNAERSYTRYEAIVSYN